MVGKGGEGGNACQAASKVLHALERQKKRLLVLSCLSRRETHCVVTLTLWSGAVTTTILHWLEVIRKVGRSGQRLRDTY
jgi:hypothetical protein